MNSSVVANRLSASGAWKVLLIEAGMKYVHSSLGPSERLSLLNILE